MVLGYFLLIVSIFSMYKSARFLYSTIFSDLSIKGKVLSVELLADGGESSESIQIECTINERRIVIERNIGNSLFSWKAGDSINLKVVDTEKHIIEVNDWKFNFDYIILLIVSLCFFFYSIFLFLNPESAPEWYRKIKI